MMCWACGVYVLPSPYRVVFSWLLWIPCHLMNIWCVQSPFQTHQHIWIYLWSWGQFPLRVFLTGNPQRTYITYLPFFFLFTCNPFCNGISPSQVTWTHEDNVAAMQSYSIVYTWTYLEVKLNQGNEVFSCSARQGSSSECPEAVERSPLSSSTIFVHNLLSRLAHTGLKPKKKKDFSTNSKWINYS